MNNGANLLGRWKKRTDEGGLFTLQSYIDYTLRDDDIGLQDERLIYDLETQYDLPQAGRHEITIGGGYRFTDSMENGSRTIFLDPEGRNDNLFNIFLQDKIALVAERWYLTLGSKLEHNDYTGYELEPSARLAWYPDDKQTLWTSVSRAVRTPNQLERDATARLVTGPGPALVALAPNPDLESEDLTAYEIGYRNQVTPNIALDVTGFYNDYRNLEAIGLRPVTVVNNGIDPPYFFVPFIVNNQMHGETYGFEVAAEWQVTPDWSLSATYSRLEMALHNDPGGAGDSDTEGRSPEHQASLRSSWNISEDWMLDTSIYYVDELPADNIDKYVRLDLNLGWRINDNLHFNLIGHNLTGAHQEFGSAGDFNAAKPATSVFGKLTWQF